MNFKKSLSRVLIFTLLFSWSVFWASEPVQADARTDSTVWYLRDQTASSEFGTTGPTAEFSSAADLVSGSPAGKATAYAMTNSPGASQATVAATETSLTAGAIWMRTYLSPELAAQTLPTGTTFRFEAGLAESNTGANMIYRGHVFLWREGTGYVSSFFDGVAATACGAEPGAANSNRSQVCITTATASDVDIQAGDQIGLEVWVNANNTVATSYTATHYLNGTNFVGNGAASHVITSSMSALSVSNNLVLQDETTDTTSWYLRDQTASSEFGITGPTAEFSSATDLVSGSPAGKATAYAMTNSPGASQATVAATETSLTAGAIWLRSYVSPQLATQTLATGTTFRFESGLAESNTGANMIYRVHVFLWREGTGYVSSFFDGVAATACGVEPGAANSNRSQVCITTATASDVDIQEGDQIGLEVWVNANNTVATSYTATQYLNGTAFVENGTASHVITSSQSKLSVSKNLELYVPSGGGGSLSVDMVDGNGAPVSSPQVTLSQLNFSFESQTATGTLGSSNEKIRVSNTTGTPAWTLSMASGSGSAGLWTVSGTGLTYDFNDSNTDGTDDADADSNGGRLTVDPSAGSLAFVSPCASSTGISKGSASSFREIASAVSSITLLTADNSASGDCSWDFTGISLSQVIPPGQSSGTYSILFTLSLL